jgi:hypothetical protein
MQICPEFELQPTLNYQMKIYKKKSTTLKDSIFKSKKFFIISLRSCWNISAGVATMGGGDLVR